MRKNFILFFILMNISTLLAENHFGIKYGINYSKFYNDNNSSFLRGYSFGVNYEYDFLEHYFIVTGLYYSKIGGLLKNKRVFVEMYRDLWMEDIKAQAGYLKIPLNIGYNFFLRKYCKVKVYFGYAFIFPINDHTIEKAKYTIQESIDPYLDVKYDYKSVGMDESVFPTGDYSNSMLNSGFGLVFKKISIDVVTYIQLGEFGTFNYISKIKKSLFTIEILIGLCF
ncbi:outer membrane beta-barrel protein [Calditrichota bacterium GD2]